MENKDKKNLAKKVVFRRERYRTSDFTLESLPKNRAAQFFDLFKIEWKTLLKIAFFLLLFSIPLLVIEVIEGFVMVNLPEQLRSDGGTPEQINNALRLVLIIYNAILIPIFMIISVSLAGFARILQRMIYGEGILFKEDFLHGIKINVKQFLIITFIYGVIRWIVYFNFYYIGTVTAYGEIFQGTSMGIFYGIFVPILLFMFCQSVIYDINIWRNFKNSYRIAIASILPSLLFGGILLSTFFLNYIIDPFIKMAVEIGLIVIVAPLFLLSLMLFAVSRFDLYINKDYYPEVYRKGLRPEFSKMEEQ